MRFGGNLPGIGPATHYGFADWFEGLDFQIEWAKRFGWRCLLPTEFRDWDLEQQKSAVARMAARDLVPPGLGAYKYNLIHPDPATRVEHVRGVCALVERAAAIGIPSVETVAGGRHPTVSYGAAPGNKAPEAWTDFVKSCREVCAACRGTGVRFVLEPFIHSIIDSPSGLDRAFAEVDRPNELGVNFDLVNFATPELAYDMRPIVDEIIAVAGPAIALLHVKDIRYDTKPLTHMWEVPPGEGWIDFDYWFGRVAALGLDIPAFMEHLTDMTQVVTAWNTVRTAAERVGAL